MHLFSLSYFFSNFSCTNLFILFFFLIFCFVYSLCFSYLSVLFKGVKCFKITDPKMEKKNATSYLSTLKNMNKCYMYRRYAECTISFTPFKPTGHQIHRIWKFVQYSEFLAKCSHFHLIAKHCQICIPVMIFIKIDFILLQVCNLYWYCLLLLTLIVYKIPSPVP